MRPWRGNVRKIFHKATYTREELVGEIKLRDGAAVGARRRGLTWAARRSPPPSPPRCSPPPRGAGQCGARGGLPPPRPPTVTGPDGQTYHLVDKGPYKAFYDAWGRLQRIEYDSNGDGKPDQIARYDGRRHPVPARRGQRLRRAHRPLGALRRRGPAPKWASRARRGRRPTCGRARTPPASPSAASTTRTATG